MEMFKLNSKLKDYSCGPIDQKRAMVELSKISEAASQVFKDETEAIPATQFILVKSEKDYLRVECHSTTEVHFSSERLSYSGGWFKRIFANHIIQFRSSLNKSEQVIGDYFSLSRENFELKYEAGYTNNESLHYVEI